MLVDSHCHLDFPDFQDGIEDVVRRAEAADVRRIVTISTRVRRFDHVRAIAERFPGVYCSVGTHPHNADKENDVAVEELVALAGHPKVVAIGEAGLDYFYDNAPRADQAAGLRRHVDAARLTGLPLVVHSRDADDDMAAILTEKAEEGPYNAVLHCFSSGRALAEAGLRLGFYISFSGILTFPRSNELRAIAADVPADRILVETDAPYLAPAPHRGKRNEPAFVARTAAVLAEARGVSPEDIAEQTTENFFRLFTKVPRP